MFRKIIAASIGLGIYAFVGSANAILIDFEEVSSTGAPVFTSLTSQGFNFLSMNHFHTIPPIGYPQVAYNGSSAYLGNDTSSGIVMTDSSAATFSLQSFDGAELFNNSSISSINNAMAIFVLGSLSGGGSVSISFTLDGITDGIGPLVDFQTFVLPSSFTNLTSVLFAGATSSGGLFFSLDNVLVNAEVTAVSEPSALLLPGLVLVGLIMKRRQRQRMSGASVMT